MATPSMTVELVGFQHGDGVFHIKALAFTCARTQSSGSHVFDSTRIVPNSAAALRAFAHQMTHHGFSLHSILSFLILKFFPSQKQMEYLSSFHLTSKRPFPLLCVLIQILRFV